MIPGGALGLSREIAVTGRLLLDDRQAPPEPVQVDFTCPNKSISVVTDAKGKFSVPIATRQVARSEVGTSVPEMTGCRLQVQLPGFEPLVVNMKHTTRLSDLELGELTLKATGGQSMAVFSEVSGKAPAKARDNYIKALMSIGAGKYNDAVSALDKAIKVYPQYASAMELKGEVLEQLGRRDEARESYNQAMAADAAYAKPIVKLAELAADDQNAEDAARWANQANRLAPGAFAKVYLVEGTAYYNLSRFDDAAKAARAGIEADHADAVPGLHRLLGEVLFRQRQYALVQDQFSRFLTAQPESAEAAEVKDHMLTCEKLARAGIR